MKQTSILILAVVPVLFSCKKSFLDVNQNPNQPTVVTPNVVLSAALAGSANNVGTDFLKVNNLMGYWSRSGSYVPDAQTEQYNIPNDYTDADWANVYNTLNSYDYIEKQGHANNTPFYIGVAKTMKAVHFSTLVDIYNDVPYSDAFKPQTSIQPKYDKGQDIYTDLVKQLDSAVYFFDLAKTQYTSAGFPGSTLVTDDKYDIMFGRGKGGSSTGAAKTRMDKWVAFANTVKLKLLVHQSKTADPGYITTEIASITTNGRGFLGAGQQASINPGYTLSTNQLSPFVGNFQTATGGPSNNAAYFRANNYALGFYSSTGDERQLSFYVPLTGTTVAGNYEGDPQSASNTFTSAVGGGFGGTIKSPSQDQLILSDFESLFIQAEATERGWLPGGNPVARNLDSLAIQQNFVYLDPNGDPTGAADRADAATYLSGAGLLAAPSSTTYLDWGAASDKIQFIITQKWAALNGINWVEAWTDFRRTGFPTSDVLSISHAATHVQNKIPVRYLYPQTELNTNSANVPPLSTPDLFNTPPFWAK